MGGDRGGGDLSADEKVCFVYVIAVGDRGEARAPVKVGLADDPEARLRNLQCANPEPLTLWARIEAPNREIARALERAFHDTQAPKRRRGEWFDIEPDYATDLMALNLWCLLQAIGFEPPKAQEVVGLALKRYRETLH